MKAIPYVFYLALIAMHQVIWRDVTSIFGVTINLTAFLVIAVALYKTETIAAWFGFGAGLLLAAGRPDVIGWHALILAFLGLTAFHVRERLNLDSLYAKMLLVASGVLLHNILETLVDQTQGLLYLLWSSAIPGALYTCILALLFFSIKEGHITIQKLKAIF